MEDKKFKGILYENEPQDFSSSDEYDPADLTDSPPPKKTVRRKMNEMQLHKGKKGSRTKAKSTKSTDKQGCLNNSETKKSRKGVKRTRYSDIYDSWEARFLVVERAATILSLLENGFPHFMKCMLPSNVSHGFWLHLPASFCNIHLPHQDSSITLVDEWGNEYPTSYLLGRHGLSAGWRGFSISHRLIKGDILIFHLTEPCKLKVHIVRVNNSDVIDAAYSLMNLSDSKRPADSDDNKKDKRRKKMKFVEPFKFDTSKSAGNSNREIVVSSIVEPLAYESDHSASENIGVGFKYLEGSNIPKRTRSTETTYESDHSATENVGFSLKYLEGANIPKRPRSTEMDYRRASFLRSHPIESVACW